jgi:ribonuclease Z
MSFSRTSRGIDWKHDHASRSAAEVETAVEEVLRCVRADDPASANQAVDDWSPEDLADLIVHMPLNHARTFLDWLPKQKASRVLADMHRDTHSDHIAALPEFNLNSWVAGRPKPLAVFGPPGVSEVVDGLNDAYRLDLTYRVAHHGDDLLAPDLGVMESRLMEAGTTLGLGDLTIASFQVNHDPVRPAVGYRFDYRGRSVVISGDATLTPGLIEAATGADLLLQDALSLPIVKSLEAAAAGSRMEKIFLDIQDYHAHTSDLSDLVAESGVRQLALYHLVPPPQNALFEQIFSRDLPEGTIITRDGMIFELPVGSEEVSVAAP